jgi:hypothetical protein
VNRACCRVELSGNGRPLIFRFLSSDYPIVITLLILIWFSVRNSLSIIRWMLNDKVDWARYLSRGTFAALGGFFLWVTVFDNWRQVIGYMIRGRERWRSDPYLLDPPADAIRVITWVLFGLAIVGTAYLFARYARGYFLPIIAGPLGFILFYTLNGLRMRFELIGPLSDRSVDFSQIDEAVMVLAWFAMFYVVFSLLIFLAFATVWGPVAFVVCLLYRLTIGRERIVEPEMYRILRERSVARQDEHRHTT